MGKLILCSGKRTDRPYVMPATGHRVYSIEELCYYIYNNIYFIDESLFSDSLIDWIRTELGLFERAEKLELINKQGADYKTLLVVVLCSADYYTEFEIKKLISAVDEIRIMPNAKRRYKRANSFLQKKQYSRAATEYERLLVSEDAVELSPSDYGDVLHNLAVARMYTYGPEGAWELFLNAYERNGRKQSQQQYFYSLWLCSNEKFEEQLKEYNVGDEQKMDFVLKMEQLSQEAKECKAMDDMNLLHILKSTGRATEFQNKALQIIDGWIDEVRKM